MMSHPEAEPRKKGGAERRQWPRATTNLTITISLDGREYSAKLRDLSRAGVCFYLERKIELMTVLELALDLPDGQGRREIRGRGAVVRCEPIGRGVAHYEIALYLHDMTESALAALDAHVRGALAGG